MMKDIRKINFLSYKLESVTSFLEYIPLIRLGIKPVFFSELVNMWLS
jgi:hypothetical protein